MWFYLGCLILVLLAKLKLSSVGVRGTPRLVLGIKMLKKRITISLSESDYDILKRLSRLQGAPMSRIVSELVETVTPVLSQMVVNFERLQAADEFVKERLRASAERAYSEAQELAEKAYSVHDMVSQGVAEAFLAANRRVQGDAAMRRTCTRRKAAKIGKVKTAENGNSGD